ncbi:hypothetical protein BOTBODRAFT_27451 [Botryobasidium botryosum FD-172 SS1]|uniref:Uncharacterized protein n=1 Tax=Botryobasidium botryosum (strain FD-172 SS1) TaxID=930990 RepID=A0A067MWP4_BOTB1|nr:hypothetical protein BOTBODRAFT_27451 [Botryobasidium botryosum FD-172 SS1]
MTDSKQVQSREEIPSQAAEEEFDIPVPGERARGRGTAPNTVGGGTKAVKENESAGQSTTQATQSSN